MNVLVSVAPWLECPLCRAGLAVEAREVVCGTGHRFDIARQGHVSLGRGAKTRHPGDTADMVRARAAFLGRGNYDRIAAAVVAGVPDEPAGLCVDLAGGTGHYLAAVLDARAGWLGLGLDSSVPAARVAARSHRRAASVAADIRDRLPIADGAAGHVLVVFGPRNGAEIARIAADHATVTVVTPQEHHLHQLRDAFGMIGIQPGKQRRLDDSLAPLVPVERTDVDYRLALPRADAVDEVLMGPSGHHLERADVEATAARMPETIEVTVAVTVSRYRHERSVH